MYSTVSTSLYISLRVIQKNKKKIDYFQICVLYKILTSERVSHFFSERFYSSD